MSIGLMYIAPTRIVNDSDLKWYHYYCRESPSRMGYTIRQVFLWKSWLVF
jgi:hypothetical protein